MKQVIFKSALFFLSVLCAFNVNAQQWDILGNSNIGPTNFFGTKNTNPGAVPIIFKVQGVEKMRMPVVTTTSNSRSSLLLGGTVGVWDAPTANYQSLNLNLDIQQPTATTYGANRSVNAKTSANGTNGIGSTEASLASSATWSAAGTFTGVSGISNVTKAVASLGHASSAGGAFSVALTNANLATSGSYTNKVAGVRGILSGTISTYPSTVNSFVAAVAGEDLINHATKTFAAYFVGKTYCTAGAWHSSDGRFKKDIKVIGNALDRVTRMRGVQYEYDQSKFPERSFSEGKTDGFIAQELREVFPELVMEGPDGYLAVNYQGVIPVLTEALKDLKNEKDLEISELETRVADKDRQINALEARLARLEAAFDRAEVAPAKAQNFLMSNQPNPFSRSTSVQISIPETVRFAELVVTDMAGKEIVRHNVAERGQASVEVNMANAPSGMYVCTLVADGQNAGTLKLSLNGK